MPQSGEPWGHYRGKIKPHTPVTNRSFFTGSPAYRRNASRCSNSPIGNRDDEAQLDTDDKICSTNCISDEHENQFIKKTYFDRLNFLKLGISMCKN
jgi:hypothetical protein